MANRFPLVLDTTDNNKIKEIQSGDNLNLADNSIVGVQNITAIGTINAADIRVAGNRLVAQAFADLTDTPSSFVGAPNYFVKVKADGTGLEYRPLSDLGNIEIDTITVNTSIVPSADITGNLGTDATKFNQVIANTLKGNLVAFNDTVVFNATTGLISYAALQGAPEFLSEFTDDVGFLKTTDLDDQLAGLFDEGQQFVTDIQGSVFGDDSTILVDGVNSIITGDVLNTSIDTAQLTASQITSTVVTAQLFEGPPAGDMQIDAGVSGIINIGTGVSTTAVNIENAIIETFDQGSGLGVAQLTANTDLAITAGNRVRIEGGVPFKFSSTTAALQLAIGAQEGDVIYNTTTSRLQMYQGGAWKDVNGNVEATTGTSNFNNVVVAGNLTVQGTTTTIDTDNTTIKDNVIILNQGESGAGVTLGTSGIEIERGSSANKTLVWDESTDKWTIGSETFVAATFEGNLTGNVDGDLIADSISIGRVGVGDTNIYGDVEFNTGVTQFQAGNAVTFNSTVDFNNTLNFADAEIVGFRGDIKGSVVGDDSTILVDGVAGKIVGDIETARLRTSETAIALGESAGLTSQSLGAIAVGVEAGKTTQGASAIAIGATAGGTNQGIVAVALGNSAGQVNQGEGAVAVGASAGTSGQGAYAIAIGVNAGILNQGTNSIIINATGLGLENTTADSFVVKPVRNAVGTTIMMYDATSGELTHTATPGTLAANIDQATVAIGATTATTIGIGNAGSTTTINGNFSLGAGALVVGEITADDSISITTAAGDGNAISIGPGGDNTTVNLTADQIRFFGPITRNIDAQAGVTGDLKGSVFADDSTILVDAVNGVIPYGVLDGAPTALSDLSNDLDYGTLVGDAIALNGLPVDTFMTGDLDAQNNNIENAVLINATVNGTLVGSAQGNHTGTLTGDVVGSVFADDSALMVDALNYAMFSDTMSLTPLNAEPANPINGMIAVADGTGWNPAANGKNTLVAYLGGAWVTVAEAA